MKTSLNDEDLAIGRHLCRRERLFTAKIGAMLVFGLPLSFLGPVTLTTMLRVAAFFARQGWQIPWLWVFLALTVVMVPLLYLRELRAAGDYFGAVLAETDMHVARGKGIAGGPSVGGRVMAGVHIALNARAVSSVFLDIFTLGPRLAVGAVGQLLVARWFRAADFRRAVEIIRLLQAVDGGLDTQLVLRPGEHVDDLRPTLGYLVFHHWIATRAAWTRIWLTSNAREVLGVTFST